MSHLVGKPTMWFPTRFVINRPVHSHKRARSLKFWIKALISFAVTAKLICVFVFAYADCWFSYEAASTALFANSLDWLKHIMALLPLRFVLKL